MMMCVDCSKEGGFSLRDDFEVVRNAIADRIGEFFLVSAAVVQRRLEYDGIWKKSR